MNYDRLTNYAYAYCMGDDDRFEVIGPNEITEEVEKYRETNGFAVRDLEAFRLLVSETYANVPIFVAECKKYCSPNCPNVSLLLDMLRP